MEDYHEPHEDPAAIAATASQLSAVARICSDPLMTSGAEQRSNLRWMRDLLARPLGDACGLPVSALSSGEAGDDAFSRRRFFALSGIELDANQTQFWFDDAWIGEASLDYLRDSGLNESALLVGYEMSLQTKRLLDRVGALYVDIWLHPVRFYEDVLFAMQSNHAEVHAALGEFHVPDRQLQLYADRLRIQSYKGWRRREPRVEPGSAAFFGQTLNDKSVCRDGRMLDLTDFLDEFDALGERAQARGGRVYYQRHPFVRKGDERVLKAVAARPWAQLSEEPTYPLLASPQVEEVMTISSSVAQEARFFGKTAEILYRPMIRFDEPERPDRFHSICQDLVSPHFWARLLAPVMPVREVEPVRFLDPKDKIRDMLGFYWSWRQIDKVEQMRIEMGELRAAAARAPAQAAPKPGKGPADPVRPGPPAPPDYRGCVNTLKGMAELEAALDAADTVSFDVFETLLERVVEKPADLFFFMGRRVREELDGAIPNFVQARQAARDWAKAEAVGEEISLAARYRAIAARFGLSEDQTAWLLEHELDWERRIMRPRVIGRRAFERARAAGKRVILISDTYFDRAFLEELLTSCGYSGWDALYASSEVGLLKRTGRLFAHVLESEGLAPDRVLHIGDNVRIDIQRARETGMRAFHTRATSDLARRVSPLPAVYDAIDDVRAASAVKALVARHVAGPARKAAPGFSQGSAYTLGYAVLGPMQFAFANWLRRQAKRDGVRELMFLSRDGHIMRRCYDALAAHDPEAPPSRYVLASRRALSVATLNTPDDLAERAGVNFSPCGLDDLLRHRFGMPLSALPRSALARHGFDEPAPRLDWGRDRARFMALAADPEAAPVLLANAREEAAALRAWYAADGIDPGLARESAIVDIGHLGTLQKALRSFLGAPELRGYYFVTFEGMDEVLPDARSAAAGFLANRLKTQGSDYMRHLHMYETAFLNDEDSLMRIERGEDGALRPRTLETEGEAPRRAFARECHEGVVAFCEELVGAFGEAALDFRLDARESQAGWALMLDHPFPLDARLFQGLGFENLYSGRGVKHLVPPPDGPDAEAIWKEGRDCLARAAAAKPAPGLAASARPPAARRSARLPARLRSLLGIRRSANAPRSLQ